jgi:hypothetical protein
VRTPSEVVQFLEGLPADPLPTANTEPESEIALLSKSYAWVTEKQSSQRVTVYGFCKSLILLARLNLLILQMPQKYSIC